MVRTKDKANVKVVGAKAVRKGPAASTSASSSHKTSGESTSSKNKYAGCNPYCPRDTPAWQKPITQFFDCVPKALDTSPASPSAGPSNADAGCSSSVFLQFGKDVLGPDSQGTSASCKNDGVPEDPDVNMDDDEPKGFVKSPRIYYDNDDDSS